MLIAANVGSDDELSRSWSDVDRLGAVRWCHQQLRPALLRAECSAQNFRAQTGAAHAQHYGVFVSSLADLLRKGLQVGRMLVHQIGNVQPAQRVLDDGLVCRLALPQRRIALPDAAYKPALIHFCESRLDLGFVLAKPGVSSLHEAQQSFVAPRLDHVEQLLE